MLEMRFQVNFLSCLVIIHYRDTHLKTNDFICHQLSMIATYNRGFFSHTALPYILLKQAVLLIKTRSVKEPSQSYVLLDKHY